MGRERDIDLVEDEVEDELEDDELAELVEEDGAVAAVGFFTGLLIGAFLGAGIALVLAPDRGEVTRQRIKRRLHDLTEDARDRFEEVRDDAGRELRVQRRRLRRRLKGRR